MICTNKRCSYPAEKYFGGGKNFKTSMCIGEKDFFIISIAEEMNAGDSIDFIEAFVLDQHQQETSDLFIEYENISDSEVKIVVDANQNSQNILLGGKYDIILKVHTCDLIKAYRLSLTMKDTMGNLPTKNMPTKVTIVKTTVNINKTTDCQENSCSDNSIDNSCGCDKNSCNSGCGCE